MSATIQTATKIPGVVRTTKILEASTYSKKVHAEFKKRDRKIELTPAERSVIEQWRTSGKDADLCASEIISARDYKDVPQAPVADVVPTNGKGKTPDLDSKDTNLDKPVDGDVPMTSNRVHGYDQERVETKDGDVYMRYGVPTTLDRAKGYCAYYSRALRTLLEVCDAKTGKVLASFDGRTLRDRAAPEGEVPTAPGTKPAKAAKTAGVGRTRTGRYSLTNPDAVATKAFELAQRKTGVKKSELIALDPDGRASQWPWVISQLAKHRKLAFTQTKGDGGDPVFHIATEAKA